MEVQKILYDTFQTDGWHIAKPVDGMQKECYIAESAAQKVFIKFDIRVAPLQRLGELGVAPAVLASGTRGDITYIIQEFIAGSYPTLTWIRDHLQGIASTMRSYHQDVSLTALLVATQQTNYIQHIDADLQNIASMIAYLDPAITDVQKIRRGFERLSQQSTRLSPTPLTPVHAEPNTKNMLVRENRLLLIDWDEVLLSDPLRDVGTFLWWYVPRNQWEQFLQYLGMVPNVETVKKCYWFSARASLAVYLWRIEHGYGDGGFLDDFFAALHMRPNSQ